MSGENRQLMAEYQAVLEGALDHLKSVIPSAAGIKLDHHGISRQTSIKIEVGAVEILTMFFVLRDGYVFEIQGDRCHPLLAVSIGISLNDVHTINLGDPTCFDQIGELAYKSLQLAYGEEFEQKECLQRTRSLHPTEKNGAD